MQLMAENLSRRSQHSKIGGFPRGAKVRRTEGVSGKPDSSRKTTWAWRFQASRRRRQRIGLPAFHLLVVAFAGLAFRLWLGPAQATLENLADMFGVVRNMEGVVGPGGATRSAVHSQLVAAVSLGA